MPVHSPSSMQVRVGVPISGKPGLQVVMPTVPSRNGVSGGVYVTLPFITRYGSQVPEMKDDVTLQ